MTENKTAAADCGCRKWKNDILLIAALLILAVAVGGFLFLFRAEGSYVTVTLDGEIYGEYPLSEDCRIQITSGGNINYLIIEGGRAYIAEATCPDGICVSHRPISREGESIVCLPNKVAVTVRGSGNSTDAVG